MSSDAALEADADKLCAQLEAEAKNGDDIMKAMSLHPELISY